MHKEHQRASTLVPPVASGILGMSSSEHCFASLHAQLIVLYCSTAVSFPVQTDPQRVRQQDEAPSASGCFAGPRHLWLWDIGTPGLGTLRLLPLLPDLADAALIRFLMETVEAACSDGRLSLEQGEDARTGWAPIQARSEDISDLPLIFKESAGVP